MAGRNSSKLGFCSVGYVMPGSADIVGAGLSSYLSKPASEPSPAEKLRIAMSALPVVDMSAYKAMPFQDVVEFAKAGTMGVADLPAHECD